MDTKFESGLEPARQDFPEVSPSQHQAYRHQPYPGHYQPYPPYQQQPYPPSSTTPKRNPSVVHSAYDGQTVSSPYSTHAQPAAAAAPPSALAPRTICGCSLLVLILSCIISLLSAAVIGLAATTGIEAQRASSAAASLAAYTASATATGTNAPSATSTAVLDDGCAANPARVNKTIYTSFALLGAFNFTRYCNRDAPNTPLLSLFTTDFATCMDACAAYTHYMPGTLGAALALGNSSSSTNANTTCAAVSYIPAWGVKSVATSGGAPGNCYLKPGPQDVGKLTTPNIGVDCHAAVMVGG